MPAQPEAGPLMAPGVAGVAFTVVASVAAADDPQALVATTLTEPLVVPTVVVMDDVVLVPVQPIGKVQV